MSIGWPIVLSLALGAIIFAFRARGLNDQAQCYDLGHALAEIAALATAGVLIAGVWTWWLLSIRH